MRTVRCSGDAREVVNALEQIHDAMLSILSNRRKSEQLARVLDAIWAIGMRDDQGVNLEGVDRKNISLALAGVARQIAWEYGLPSENLFDE